MRLWPRSIKADTVIGIKVDSMNEYALREMGRVLLDLAKCEASDTVKIAAIEAVKARLSAPLTISDCTVKMG